MYFCHISMLSVRRFCLNKLTILSFFLFISSHINAQIDIKSKVDAQTYADYSKAIDLIEKNTSPNDIVTFYVANNYALERLGDIKYQNVFVNNDVNSIKQFLENHSIQKFLTNDFIIQKVIVGQSEHAEIFKSNSTFRFVKNDTKVMLTDNLTFEANIEKSLQFNSNIFLFFINGVVKY